jgi:hypothetical protein
MTRIKAMKKIMIQFHASLEELVEFANAISSEFGLFMTVMTLRPFTLKSVNGSLSREHLSDGDVRIIFTIKRPLLDATSPNNFYDLNPGSIGLHIGQMTEQGLEESTLAFISDDKEKIDIANQVASRLKKITKSGAIAVNPINGVEAKVRSHRYTEGAKSLYNEGVKMLPIAGNSFFKFPD